MEKDNRLLTYSKLVMMAVFWGGTFIAARLVAQHVPPFSAAFFRFIVASGFMVVFTLHFEGEIPLPRLHQLIPVILLGMTGAFSYNYFFFSGLKTVHASRAAIIIATNPILTAVFASAFLGERLHVKNFGGIFLCAAGAIFVITRGEPSAIFSGGIGIGEIYILGCVASWVAYSLIGKITMKDMTPMVAVTYSCIIGAAALFFPACNEGLMEMMMNYSLTDWGGIFYLGFFGSALGFTWYYQGIKALGASRAAVFINFVPVSAVIMAFFMLHEDVDTFLIVGALMVIVGAYMTNRRD